MELLDFLPKQLKTRYLPWSPIKIMPLGDIQLGSQGCDVDRLQRHVDWGVRNGVYFIGMGDYSDFLSPSNRQRLRGASLYDTAQQLIDEWHLRHLDQLKDILAPTRGRWIGLLEGHHFHEFDAGGTTDTLLAEYLGIPFLGTCAIVRLNFRDEANKRSVSAHIWAHHGEGSGATVAAPFNKLERASSFVEAADVLLMGHYHRAGALLINKLRVAGHSKPRLRHRTVALVATGSFLKGYQQGSRAAGRASGSYVERGILPPTALGNVVVTLTPRHADSEDFFDIACTTMSI